MNCTQSSLSYSRRLRTLFCLICIPRRLRIRNEVGAAVGELELERGVWTRAIGTNACPKSTMAAEIAFEVKCFSFLQFFGPFECLKSLNFHYEVDKQHEKCFK